MLKKILTFVFFLLFGSFSGYAQTGIPVSQMASCDTQVSDFLKKYDIPGATFALAKDGKLVYLRAFGYANIGRTEPTQPYHLFRIASVSKPITAIAIMKLVENGQLSLSDKVFGAGGILANHPVLSKATITDARIYNITVQNLLEHSAGCDSNTICAPDPTTPYSFQFTYCDPISFPLHVTQTNGTTNPATEEDMIYFLLEKGLNFAPNSRYVYSNVGFLALGEIIETISDVSYENYVKNNVLSPLGICDMHIGKNLLQDKQEREGEYIGNGYTTLSCYGTGEYVSWEYGGYSVEIMDAHGGWIATARDLVRLLVSVDGFSTKPDILNASTISQMVAPSLNNTYYAKGWSVNTYNNWWHFGALDGTATFFARTSVGYNWAILLNKRPKGDAEASFWSDFDILPWNCIAATTSYPSFDLMDLPTKNSSGITFSQITTNSITVNWSKGNGNKRILVVKENSTIRNYPLDGSSYNASSSFGLGNNLGNNSFVAYNGIGNSVTITNLAPGTNYRFRVFEYNQSANTGNYPLYMLCDSEEAMAATTTGCALNSSIIACDINGDKKKDVILKDNAGVIKYTTNLINWTQVNGSLEKSVACGDINCDGMDDIIGMNNNSSIYYTLDKGSNWQNIPGSLDKIFLADMNGDGKTDILGLNPQGYIYITYNLLDWINIPGVLNDIQPGNFNTSRAGNEFAGINTSGYIYYTNDLYNWTNIPGALSGLFSGDINGDGKADLLGLNANNEIYYTTNLTTWTSIPGGLVYITTGDFNGDGKDDVAGLGCDGNVYYSLT